MVEYPICGNGCEDCRELILDGACSPENPDERWANLVGTIRTQTPDEYTLDKKVVE